MPVAVNTLLTADDYAYMLGQQRRQGGAGLGRAAAGAAGGACARAPNELQDAVRLAARPAPLPEGAQEFEAALAAHEPLAEPAATAPQDHAFWLYSSGSTGKPKGTVHTHGNPWWTAELYGKPVLGLTENDVCFSAAKLYFAYGLGNALTFPLSVGATVLLMAERPTPDATFKRWTGAAQAHRLLRRADRLRRHAGLAQPARARGGVAAHVLLGRRGAAGRDLAQRFKQHFGCEIIDGIGSTEMLHIFISNRPGDIRYGTTGRPVEGYEIELRGEDGQPVAEGEVGDLYIKGPSAALMYWGNPREERATPSSGGWTKSGDKYSRDADGYYTYAGRSDDMLKVSGIYVSPFEVEATLMQHPAVLEAAVIGKEDADGLTKTKAYVVRKAGPGGRATTSSRPS